MATISEALRIALELHQANRLQEAAELYRRILDADPSVADAWHLLGVLHHQSGQHEQAADLISAAIGRDPHCAAYHDNLGAVRRSAGDPGRAAACHRRAVALDPEAAKPLAGLGAVQLDLGQAEAGLDALRHAVRLAPDHEGFLLRLGDALLAQGRAGEAEVVYGRLSAARPERPDYRYRLGVSHLTASGLMTASLGTARRTVDAARLQQAIAQFERAARDGHADARRNLYGTAILALQNGVLDDPTLNGVARAARRDLAGDPRHTVALAVVCYGLYRAKRLDTAVRFFRKHARHFTAEQVACDFELLVWSLVQADRAFFERLAAEPPRMFDRPVRRILAARRDVARPVILVGCDDGYWRRFGADFLASARERAPACAVHVHVVNPSEDTLRSLAGLAADGMSCSCEAIDLGGLSDPARLTYYASARFAVARDLLRQGEAPIIQVDVDALVLADPGAAMAVGPGWDVAFLKDNRGRGPTRDILAGFIAFNRTEAGLAFLDRVVAYIGRHFDEGRVYWGLDQAAPYCTYDHLLRHGKAPSAIWHDFETFPYLRFLDK